MSYTNVLPKERMLTKIIKILADEMGIELEIVIPEMILRLRYENEVKQIFRYDWDLNSAAAQLIAKDKFATYELLKKADIPCVEYHLFHSPKHPSHSRSTWNAIFTFAADHHFRIVGKPNNGTGGNDVMKATTLPELERMVDTLFTKYRIICLSPYYEIACEYRVILLDGEAKLVYGKQRPSLKGDGIRTIWELLNPKKNAEVTIETLDSISNRQLNLNRILQKDETVLLGWQHNLGKRSSAQIVEDAVLRDELIQIAQETAEKVGVRFASIDVIQTATQELKIMEVNSGVMMEHFAKQGLWEYDKAKAIYRSAIEKMLHWKPKREKNYASLSDIEYV